MLYVFGDYVLDTLCYELRRAGATVPLRPQVFQVLAYLLAHHDRVVLKQELLEHLWPGQYVGDAAVNYSIMEVRKAIGDDGHIQRLLRTVRGRGYRFVAPVEVQDQRPPADPLWHVLPATLPAAGSPAATDPASPAVLHVDGEYKPVSILCCALGDAPTLATQLGPEGLYQLLEIVVGLGQDVVQVYQGTFISQTSEGFTAVFGAPVAQEDHARRAVLAALDLHQRLRHHLTLRTLTPSGLAARMGLHSGLVVVGGLGQDPQQLYTAIGAATQLAMRLQQQATPGTILMSAATYQLVHTEVQVAPNAALTLDGPSTPELVYAVQGLLGRRAGVAGRGARVETPFVGRARELALLHDRLAAACVGQGQLVVLVGEPGMGKTRLLTEFYRSLAGQPVTVAVGQCLSYGQASPYLPVRDLVRQVCALAEGDEAAAHIAAVQRWLHESGVRSEEDVALMLQLLDLPVAPERLARLSPEARLARTFVLLRHLVLHAAQRQPLVLVVEDLHWSDATSEAWLASLVERLADASLLLVVTARPGYWPRWGAHSAATQFGLSPLHAQDSRVVVQAVLGHVTLPAERLREMVAHAAGNPFFLEELASHAREYGQPGTPGLVPETVHAVLAARMDQLPPAAKRLLQTAAVIGTEVPLALLQAIAEQPEEVLQQSLGYLQAAEFLYETRVVPALIYTFKHALTHEVAYRSLLKRTRQRYHQRTAQVLAERFPDLAEAQPERLAQHYTEAGLAEPAVGYWQRAAQRAMERSAYVEAVAHCTTGLDVLGTLADTPTRTRHELEVQLTLGQALGNTKGFAAPETGHALARARELCQQVGDPPRLFAILAGLRSFYWIRGELQTARQLAEECLTLAQHQPDPARLLEAHQGLGITLYRLGELVPARAHLEQGIALYTPQQDHSLQLNAPLGLRCFNYAALTLWTLGYPDQALMRLHEALAHAQELSHPYSLARGLSYAALLHGHRWEWSTAQEQAEAALALSTAQGFGYWVGYATFQRGWALAAQGQGEEGIAQMGQGLAAIRATGAVGSPHVLAKLAEAYGGIGQAEEGLHRLAEALAAMDNTGERCDEAELYRIKGELLLRQAVPDAPQAEACFQQALAVAHHQQAKSLELRAAMSLSRLWQRQGKRAEAQQLLAELYGWFSEGFDTADLQEAKALLDELP